MKKTGTKKAMAPPPPPIKKPKPAPKKDIYTASRKKTTSKG